MSFSPAPPELQVPQMAHKPAVEIDKGVENKHNDQQ
jgi:hypothetical protein